MGLRGAARSVEFGETGAAVGVHPAFEVGQALARVFALAVGAEAIAGGWRGGSAPRSFVAGIDPQARGACLAPGGATARGLQAHGGVVCEDGGSGAHMVGDLAGDRLQQGRALADPVCQRGAVEVDAVACEYLGLAIERQMVGVLAHRQMGQQAGSGASALDGARRQRRLGEAFAGAADHSRSHDAVDHDPGGYALQFLGDVLADGSERAAAGTAGACGFQDCLAARQSVRQGAALAPLPRHAFDGGFGFRGRACGAGGLLILQRQLQPVQGFRPRPEAMPARPRQLMTQLLNQDIASLQLGRQGRRYLLQEGGIVGERRVAIEHEQAIPHPSPQCKRKKRIYRKNIFSLSAPQRYPATASSCVRTGNRKATSSIGIDNRADIETTSRSKPTTVQTIPNASRHKHTQQLPSPITERLRTRLPAQARWSPRKYGALRRCERIAATPPWDRCRCAAPAPDRRNLSGDGYGRRALRPGCASCPIRTRRLPPRRRSRSPHLQVPDP